MVRRSTLSLLGSALLVGCNTPPEIIHPSETEQTGSGGGGSSGGTTDTGVADTGTDVTEAGSSESGEPAQPCEEWTRMVGGPGADSVRDVVVGADGSLYAAGWTQEGLAGGTFLGGEGDAFAARLDMDGTLAWTREIGTDLRDEGRVLAAHPDGGAVVAWDQDQDNGFIERFNADGESSGATPTEGTFYSGFVFDGESNRFMTGMFPNNDGFAAKWNAAGEEQFSIPLTTAEITDLSGIALDAAGNMIVLGMTEGELPGPNLGSGDAFVHKYDADGNEIWTIQRGTSEHENPQGLAADPDGNIYIATHTQGAYDGFDAAGGWDYALSKFDPDGNELWTMQGGTAGQELVLGCTVDPAGNVYIVGTLQPLDAEISEDVYAIKFSPEGGELWARTIDSNDENDFGNTIIALSEDDLVIGGATEGAFGDETNAGLGDAFVMRICGP